MGIVIIFQCRASPYGDSYFGLMPRGLVYLMTKVFYLLEMQHPWMCSNLRANWAFVTPSQTLSPFYNYSTCPRLFAIQPPSSPLVLVDYSLSSPLSSWYDLLSVHPLVMVPLSYPMWSLIWEDTTQTSKKETVVYCYQADLILSVCLNALFR